MPTDTTNSATFQQVIKWEQENYNSRDDVTILAGEDIVMGEVLGQVTVGSVPTTGTAAGGNTGGGTMTPVTGSTGVKVGTYTMTCVGLDTNGGVFSVKDPDSQALPAAGVGAAYTSDQINFTLNDVGADFIVGDSFTVVVPAGSESMVALEVAAIDGSAIAAGISKDDYDASASGDRTIAFTSGGTYQITAGDTITGATNGATARVYYVDLTSGTFAAGTAAGTLYLNGQSGTFISENLDVGGNSNVATIGGNSSAIAASDVPGVMIARNAQYVDDYLTWPSGITDAQKTLAKKQLKSLGIIERDLV